MTEIKQGSDGARSFAPVIGFALGALVGGTLALLLAPASGARTRRRIGDTARRLSARARHTLAEAGENVSDAATSLGTDVKSAIDAGREAFRHDGHRRERRPAPRIVQGIDAPPTQRP